MRIFRQAAAWLAVAATCGAGTFSAHAAEGGKTVKNSLGMALVQIAPGEFQMGHGEAPPKSQQEFEQRDYDELPVHTVRITQPFYLGATEVTNAQYEAFDPEHKQWRGVRGVSRGDDDPVVHVTWQQAVDFCAWLSKKEGKPYRLPTEAEWEYACRAGTTTLYSTGDTLGTDAANLGVSDGKPRLVSVAVGGYQPNPWGLYDMHGNVEEWCHDWYGPYEAEAQADPIGRADGVARVTRGGSYNHRKLGNYTGAGRYCRSANRSGYLADDANRVVGFRVVQAELPQTKPLPVAEPPLNQRDVSQQAASPAGADPKEPYFDDFRDGRRPTIPADTWGPIYSAWNHYASVCVCPNGDVLAAWYTTKSEAGHELAQAATRLRAGSDKWQPVSSFLDIPDMNDHAPVIVSDGKRLYHFFGQGLRGWDDSGLAMRTSDDSGATWSRPRMIWSRDEKVTLSQPCSAVIQKDGLIALAADGDGHRNERVIVSGDGGQTWQMPEGDLRQAYDNKYVIHPAMVALKDGSWRVFARGPNPMPTFVSRDSGKTWQASETTLPGIGVGQKSAVLRLASGAVLLLSSDSKRQVTDAPTYVALSDDGGQTWKHFRPLGSVGGYMSLAQGSNGVIYAFGTRMSCAAFNEAWVREGKAAK